MSTGGNIRRATLEIVVLKLLLKKEYYVYELIHELDNLSGGLYTVPEPTIYPVMYRLLEKGFIKDRSQEFNRRIRVYYSITESGREYYNTILKEYSSIMTGLAKIVEEDD